MKFSDEFIDSMGRSLHAWWDRPYSKSIKKVWIEHLREALEQADKCYPLVERPTEEVTKIKEQYKNAERDFLKNCQAIHGKEEGLRQYNEIMERENGKNLSN